MAKALLGLCPTIWFHDVFYKDGKPYRQREVEIIRSLTSGAAEPK